MPVNAHSQIQARAYFLALSQAVTVLTSISYAGVRQECLIRAKINSTTPTSPHAAWFNKVPIILRFDNSIDSQSPTCCLVFTGSSSTQSYIGVAERLEQQNSLRSAHVQPKLERPACNESEHCKMFCLSFI